jgi:kumamolisin
MFATEATCLTGKPNVIVSQSFGDDESSVGLDTIRVAHAMFKTFTGQGDTLVSGSGDFGATEENDDTPTAEYPSSDPLVTAVGGTEGKPYPGGLLRGRNGNAYGDEQVWNEGDTFGLATGGAPSAYFKRPNYQDGFTNFRTRTTSDVAYNAAINGGELVVFGGQLGNFGGTSAGVPHWAALFALANQARTQRGQDTLGHANPALYSIAGNRRSYNQDFHDITDGNNRLDSDVGFRANGGYDIPTGLGTPDVKNLLGDLVGGSSHHRDDNGDDDPSGDGRHGGRHHMRPS